MKKITVKVPASTANLGPGFDTLSLALDLYNEFTFENSNQDLEIISNVDLPKDSSNLIYKSFSEPFKALGKSSPKIKITVESKIPLSAGLGSSSTAVVGGLVAANYYLNDKLSEKEILEMATEIEGHPDNVAAAICGGFTVTSEDRSNVYLSKLEWPSELLIVVVTPEFDLPTKRAREVLPQKVEYGDAVFNISRSALLVSSLVNKDWENLRVAFKDKIHQDYRKELVPGMDMVLKSALDSGAIGATLSGAGPTLAAFCLGDDISQKVSNTMQDAWKKEGVSSKAMILKSAKQGASILS